MEMLDCNLSAPFLPFMTSLTLTLALVICSFKEDVDLFSLAMGPVGIAGGPKGVEGVARGVNGILSVAGASMTLPACSHKQSREWNLS